MNNLGIILGWKYKDAPGIKTKNNKIIGWPKGLGPKPTISELSKIKAEYLSRDKEKESTEKLYNVDNFNYMVMQKLMRLDNRVRALEGKGNINISNLKNELSAILRSK